MHKIFLKMLILYVLFVYMFKMFRILDLFLKLLGSAKVKYFFNHYRRKEFHIMKNMLFLTWFIKKKKIRMLQKIYRGNTFLDQ